MKILRQMSLAFWFFVPAYLHAGDEIEKVSLPVGPDMQRADIYVWNGVKNPKAVLVLCPGCNGNGEEWIRQSKWQEFAKKHRLGLIGLSFASNESLLNNGRGYYFASQGSGKILLQGIKEAFKKDLPILLFGFSGGAHFSSRFAEWKPERVLTWCAYSAGYWDEPKKVDIDPPGLVICGDQDGRYGASLIYFKQGRALGKPWLWISVPNTGHSINGDVEKFVSNYFAVLIESERKLDPSQDGVWVDIDRKTKTDVNQEPLSVTAWLPEKSLFEEWRNIHQP